MTIDDPLGFIIDSAIETTALVAVGGSVFYFLKGATLNSPGSGRNDLAAGADAFFANAPRIQRCAAWSGVMQAIDLGIQHVRQVNDPLNIMLAWGASNALFSVHQGPRAAVRQGLKGAAVGGAVGIGLLTLMRLVCSEKSCG